MKKIYTEYTRNVEEKIQEYIHIDEYILEMLFCVRNNKLAIDEVKNIIKEYMNQYEEDDNNKKRLEQINLLKESSESIDKFIINISSEKEYLNCFLTSIDYSISLSIHPDRVSSKKYCE